MMQALFSWMFFCLAMLFSHAVAGAEAAVDARAATVWLNDYSKALQARNGNRLAELIEDKTTVQVNFIDEGEAPLEVTLSREEYLQQLRALWRFAANTQYETARAAPVANADGTLQLAVDITEHWQLFGIDTGQHSRLQIRLAQRDGNVRAVSIRSTTRPRQK